MSCGYFQHGGVTFPGLLYSPRGLEAARDFPVEDDDVFNVTYQKSGTVWMLEILSLIRQGGDPQWCRSVPNWDRGPWLETLLGLRRARRNARPRIISSHLPVHMFPKAFFGSKAKVVYTVRDPKDVLVSLFHFARIFRPYKDPGSLGDFLDKFLEGDVPFGSWFQHVRGWLQLRGRDNFFWISYEELQQDLRGSVQRLCQFLGRPLGAAALDAVVANASFVTMSHNPMSNFSLSPNFILDRRRGPFLRKGISGDWRNHLSPEQSRRFDLVYRERMAGLGVSFPWDGPETGPGTPKTDPGTPEMGPGTPEGDPKTATGEGGEDGDTPKGGETAPKTPQEPQKTPQGTPKSAQDPPKSAQDPPKTPQGTPKTPQGTPKSPQDPPKTPQDPPKSPLDTLQPVQDPPKTPQDPPKTPQGTPKTQELLKIPRDPPKNPQEPPKNPQGSPKTHQDPPKTPQGSPKTPQDPPKPPQDPPKPPQDPPNPPQDPPKPPQDPPKPPQDPPKPRQDPPKPPQDPPEPPQDLTPCDPPSLEVPKTPPGPP